MTPGRAASAPRSRGEHGFAAPVVVALTGLLVVAALVGAAGGRLLVTQRQAATAADLAALAAASAVQLGRPACESARQAAAANGAALVSCSVTGKEVAVETTVVVETLLDRKVVVRGRARAGPVSR